jgi:prepilin-type N-terminal cleavage/methylation domain-containing protein
MIQRLKKSHAGFTLLEVLLSITLLGLLMVAVYNIITSSTDKKDQLTAEDRDRLQVETFFLRLDADLSQIYSPLYHSALRTTKDVGEKTDPNPQFSPGEKYPAQTQNGDLAPIIESGDKSSLSFLTSSNRRRVQDSKECNYAWVKYSLRDPPGPAANAEAPFEIVRQFNPNNIYNKEFEWTDIKAQILLKRVKSLEFLFWNPAREDFSNSLTDLENKNLLRAIKIKLIWKDLNNQELTFEKIFRPLWPFFNPEAEAKSLQKKPSAPNTESLPMDTGAEDGS